jgi:hypothetical protein
MRALEQFTQWMAGHTFIDRNSNLPPGMVLNYHSRSDDHSKILGRLIIEDILDTCEPLRKHAEAGRIAARINHRHYWANGKSKTLDLAIGIPSGPPRTPLSGRIRDLAGEHRVRGVRPVFERLLIACEEKAVMTEHGKSQPRIYSELNDSHTIVHQGDRYTVATGITMVNIASTFVSPLRQRPNKPVHVSHHAQPAAAASMIEHLTHLPLRDGVDDVGFDAYSSFVVNLDNQGTVELYTDPPAPQPGDSTNYGSFLERICRHYAERFGDLDSLPAADGLTIEEQLIQLALQYPNLMQETGRLIVKHGLEGSTELEAVLQSIGERVRR